MASLKTKSELGIKTKEGDTLDQEILPKNSLHETPQHLLFAHYLMQCLHARASKTKLMYTLNAFRAIQKRLTLELREVGSRDRVMGDANIVKASEKDAVVTNDDVDGGADMLDLEDTNGAAGE